jgi:31-O-methyltransferase
LLTHPDPTQLFFQVAEIGGDRTYLRHGVSVGPGDVVVDVGANVGVAAVFFATICGARRVHCFEPVAPTAEILRANARSAPACTVHEQALGRTSGTTSIAYYPQANAMSGLYVDPRRDRALVRQVLLNHGLDAAEADGRLAGRYEPEMLSCEMRTVSSALVEHEIDRVDLLKIDVERSELDVLAGIEDADWPKIRQVVMEIHDEEGRGDQVIDSLRSHGFRVVCEQETAMRKTSVRMLYGTRP